MNTGNHYGKFPVLYRILLPLLVVSLGLITGNGEYARREAVYRAHPCYQGVQNFKRQYPSAKPEIRAYEQSCRDLAILERDMSAASGIMDEALKDFQERKDRMQKLQEELFPAPIIP